ncbi:MAG: protease, partial [Acidobacteriota bacterium]|nr:protease [Acidobacteriota bacterium]
DTTYRSAGAGVWCLMAGGSWGDGGHQPSHLCAWAKAQLGWLEPRNIMATERLALWPIESRADVCRLWEAGKTGPEYFLVENRLRQGFDLSLPSGGLLIWHIDDRQSNNDDLLHYRVGLQQADGRRDLERGQNDGDAGDPYNNHGCFDDTSRPNSRNYFGDPTGVAVRNIIQRESGEVAADVEVSSEGGI